MVGISTTMADPVKKSEQGFLLIPVLLLMLVLGFVSVILLYTVFSGSVISSQKISQSSMQTALSIGAGAAASQLNAYTNWPEIMASSGGTMDGYQNIGSTVLPVAPTNSFWYSCSGNNTCLSQSVSVNGVSMTVQWTIMPSNGYAKRLSGYVYSSGANGPTQRDYLSFIHVQAPSGQQATEEVILKKSLL